MLANAWHQVQYLIAASHRPPNFFPSPREGLHAPRLPCQLCLGAFCFCEAISRSLAGGVWIPLPDVARLFFAERWRSG
jgi:hypothetical protein